ncbi:MAG: hypothetical protein PHU40_11630 [Sulfurimonas sp.]|nr:hypothetical protein [Sulfurimonas sp.]
MKLNFLHMFTSVGTGVIGGLVVYFFSKPKLEGEGDIIIGLVFLFFSIALFYLAYREEKGLKND